MQKLFLLDGMALVYRAYFAMQRSPRYTSYGLNTSAILGFANTLYDILKNENPTHIAVAFDTAGPTSRHEEFTEYKANREAMPDDLAESLPIIRELIEAFNIPVLIAEGYEADDIIGTLAKNAEKEGFQVYMVTPDKDFGQLVSENIFIYKPGRMGNKAEILGVAEVCERFGINYPTQMIDLLGLMGDASDNIPGIFGVGEVTAKKLIAQFGSIENIYKNENDIKNPKLKQKVIDGKDSALLSRQLATIILDTPVEFDAEAFKKTTPNVPKLKALLEKLEIRNFAKRVMTDLSISNPELLLNESSVEIKKENATFQPSLFDNQINTNTVLTKKDKTSRNYNSVDNDEDLDLLIEKIYSSKKFSFEILHTNNNTPELLAISVSVEDSSAWFIPVFKLDEVSFQKLKNIFGDKNILKIGHNIKSSIEFFKKIDIKIDGDIFDTMIAHYIVDPESRHDLITLSKLYLNFDVSETNLLTIVENSNFRDNLEIIEKISENLNEKADVIFSLQNALAKELKETSTENVFKNIEMPLIQVLASMEEVGVQVNSEALAEYSKELQKEIQIVQEKIWEHAGQQFNVSSPKQLGEILFEKLKIVDKPKLTKTKQYQTGEDVLQKIIDKHPIISLVLDYRSLTKLKTTYIDALPLLINPTTNRIHTSYNQAVTATGRLSSTNPNLQNIPIRTEKGREVRKAFVPRNSDYLLLSADYSQIELRIIASISNDEFMIKSFQNGEDIHTATAAKIYGTSLENVDSTMRRNAKSVNFGIIYGISAFGLSEQIGSTRQEAAKIIEQYFETFPGIKEYMSSTIDFAHKNEFVETILGRRRYIRNINSSNAVVRNFAVRNAINAPIQGSAADMIKIAMINIFDKLNSKNMKTRMTMQVHDELVFDVYKPELDDVKSIVRECMENAMKLDVPIVVEIGVGSNWLEAH